MAIKVLNVTGDNLTPGATEQDFLDLAKEVSIDPSAKQNSGSLGSAVASTYVPEFAAAAVALEPGEISRPVKTQFGWHVIRVDDVRDATLPEIDTLRQQIVQSLQQQRLAKFQEDLRSKAKIE